MIVSGDFELYYPLWEKADAELCNVQKIGLFRRFVDLYIVACALGIQADKIINDFDNPLEKPKSFARNTYLSFENSDLHNSLDYMLRNALLTSKTIDIDIEERLKLAFDPEYENKKIGSASQFLNGFANYGLHELYSIIEANDSMAIIDKIFNFLVSKTESNYDEILNLITMDELKK